VATVEVLYRRGLLPAVRPGAGDRSGASGRPSSDRRSVPRLAGHFAGLWYRADRLDPADPDFAKRGPAAAGAMIPQQAVEELLARRAAELGVEARRGIEVTGYTADGDGVTVTADGQDLRAGWRVGCDGGHRQRLGRPPRCPAPLVRRAGFLP
jgi:2-polyprenyl-6-methoxyphenol hydroxylase-like FAD-dependent oxidoreductase